MSFGKLLHQLRVDREVSLRDMSRDVGLSPVYISDIERGQRKPPATPIIFRIARALQVDPQPLLTAALEERDSLELPLSTRGERRSRSEAAAALARMWEDDEAVDALNNWLHQQRGHGGSR